MVGKSMSTLSTFWFVAGAMCGLALALLLGPWLRTGSARLRGMLAMPAWALGAAIIGICAAAALYLWLGNAASLQSTTAAAVNRTATDGASQSNADSGGGSMDAVVAALEARLKGQGGSDTDWELLAKSYEFLNRAADAALARKHELPSGAGNAEAPAATAATVAGGAVAPAAPAEPLSAKGQQLLQAAESARQQRDYAKARDLYKQLDGMRQMTADAWADYADVSASLNGNQLAGEPERYVNEALRLDPRHPKALWLQGSVEHETRRYAQAMATWQRLLAVMEPGSSDAKLISANLEEDRRLAAGADNKPAAAGAVTLRGEVTLGEKLRAQVRPGMTLYILAKSVDSPGAPVAVIRSTTNTWPVSFELNDSQAMLPERNLSSAGKVIVEARISISGQAASQPGDLLGSTAPLQPAGSKPLRIVIDKVAG